MAENTRAFLLGVLGGIVLLPHAEIAENRQFGRALPKRDRAKEIRINALIAISALFLIAALILIPFPSAFDRPITAFFNIGAVHSPLLDCFFNNLAIKYTPSGVIFFTCLWYCWFSSSAEMKARILSGTLVSFAAGVFSRFLQHLLPSHPRPIHDSQLAFQLPRGVDPNDFNSWDSFPSDHAAVWFGLALVVYIAHRKLGVFTLIWAGITLFSRNYLGFHYPTDIVGGAGLGLLSVGLIQLGIFQRFARHVVDWSERRAPLFYALAFFLSYQIGTLFDDLRQAARSFADILHGPSI